MNAGPHDPALTAHRAGQYWHDRVRRHQPHQPPSGFDQRASHLRGLLLQWLLRLARQGGFPISQRPIRLLALAASPVFYQAPLYRLIAADPRLEFEAIFASNGGIRPHLAGFGSRKVIWDVDMLSGYRHSFLRNADRNDHMAGFFALRDWDVLANLARRDFDILWVQGYSYLTLWLAILGALRRGKPVLVREEQTLLHQRPAWKETFRSPILRWLFTRSYGLAVGTNNRAFFRYYGVPEERLFNVPYCVDNYTMSTQAVELAMRRIEIRRRFGITDEHPVITFVGKLTAKKQPGFLVEAFARLRHRQRCTLLLVGDGELEQELRGLVAARAIPDVHFIGFLNRSEIGLAYTAADVFVLPSAYHETWGLVVNEAMNFGLPVVVSDKVGCAPDLVRDGENGFIFPSGDVTALVATLDRLTTDSLLRRQFGDRSLEIVSAWNYQAAADGIAAACAAAYGSSQHAHSIDAVI
jgi:glycosyltransferase involved in cell wall biosynthesis